MTTEITVVFETDKAVFHFTVKGARDHLDSAESEYDEKEVTVLKDLLSSVSGDRMTIPRDLRLFPHIVFNLIRDSMGTVYCRTCGKTYESGELNLMTVGHRETPLSVNVKGKGWLQGLLGKKQRLPLFGGGSYACLEGHELISFVTWRTQESLKQERSGHLFWGTFPEGTEGDVAEDETPLLP
jgi:hypothetical protein